MILKGFYIKCSSCGKLHVASLSVSKCKCGADIAQMTMQVVMTNNLKLERE